MPYSLITALFPVFHAQQRLGRPVINLQGNTLTDRCVCACAKSMPCVCVSRPAAVSLGQTKNKLQSYLSRFHVRYTFAGDDFMPDPEAPLIKVSS